MSTSTKGSGAPSVVLGHKVVTNGEEIVSEFLGVVGGGRDFLTRNQVQCCLMFSERTFNEIDSESSQSVTVGDHNTRDMSLFDELQKGDKSPALEVEAGSDITDDFVVRRVLLFEEVLLGRDASVQDGESTTSLSSGVGCIGDSKVETQILFVISSS